jgi:IgA Peptidase M64
VPPKFARLWLLLASLALSPVPARAEPATQIRIGGDPANRLDLVVLGDGYTAGEQAKFAADVATFVTTFFAQDPYKEYASYFNVYRIDAISAESGASHPERGVVRNTAFRAAYNCGGTQRLICVSLASVNDVLARSLPPAQRDLAIVLVNDTEYGGSGGAVAVGSINVSSVEIVLHEMGHSLGLLGDEYPDGGTCDNTREPPFPNVTIAATRAAIKWGYWIDGATPIPTGLTTAALPGLYEGAYFCPSGNFRPTYNSKMRTLGLPFDQINSEQLIKRFYNFVSPIEAVDPPGSTLTLGSGEVQTFRITSPRPAGHALSVAWTVDGVAVAAGASFPFSAASVAAGAHAVQAIAQDTTSAVRNDPGGATKDAHTWTVTTSGGTAPPTFRLDATPTGATVAAGESAAVTIRVSSPLGAFGENVSLTCGPLPTAMSCSFTPQTIVPGLSADVTLTIRTAQTAPDGAAVRLLSTGVPVLLLLWTSSSRRRGSGRRAVAALMVCVAIQAGCGGGNPTPAPAPGPGRTVTTPPGSYDVVVKGQSGSIEATTTITVSVK